MSTTKPDQTWWVGGGATHDIVYQPICDWSFLSVEGLCFGNIVCGYTKKGFHYNVLLYHYLTRMEILAGRARTHTHTPIHEHPRTETPHTHAHSCTRKHTHARTYARTHTRTHTHTHTHTWSRVQFNYFPTPQLECIALHYPLFPLHKKKL